MKVLLQTWAVCLSTGISVAVSGVSVPLVMVERAIAQENAGETSESLVDQDHPEAGDRFFQSGQSLQDNGDFAAALEAFEAALAIYEAVGDRAAQIDTLNQMGNVYLELGQYEQATAAYQDAIALQQQDAPQPATAASTDAASDAIEPLGTRSSRISSSEGPPEDSSPAWGEPGGSRGARLSSQSSSIVAMPPPDMSQPGWGEPGGSRGSALSEVEPVDNNLVALVDHGPTLSDYPTLYVYLPDLLAEITTRYGPLEMTVTILDDQGTVMHESSRLSPDTAGILGIPLAEFDGLGPLSPTQTYKWNLQIFSLASDLNLEGAELTGVIERVEAASVDIDVETVPVPELHVLYREAGVWYDAVSALFEQWHANPDDSTVTSDLQRLLISVGLDNATPENFIGHWSELAPYGESHGESLDGASDFLDDNAESGPGGAAELSNPADLAPSADQISSPDSNGQRGYEPPADIGLPPWGAPGGTR